MTFKNSTDEMFDVMIASFKQFDDEQLARDLEWHQARKSAGEKYRDAYKSGELDFSNVDRRDRTYAFACGLVEAYGGKSLTQLFQHHAWREVVAANHHAKIAKRNARLVYQLTKEFVTSVKSAKVTHSHDGFDGCFHVDTDQGQKVIKITTIFAWGPVNRPHYRVKVKVSH
jgi:hypothetical protein